jgi:hypothetical protein
VKRAHSDSTELRSSGFYVRLAGVWYQSSNIFKDAYPTDISLRLYSLATGEEVRVPASEVEAMERVRARVKYRGRWFSVNSFWSLPSGPDWREPQRGRIRGWVAAGSPDCFAHVGYRGPEGREVAKFPGAQVSGEWPTPYDEVMLTIPVSEIEDYAEEVSVIPPREG